jgi:hypothetical protein
VHLRVGRVEDGVDDAGGGNKEHQGWVGAVDITERGKSGLLDDGLDG